MFFDSIVDMFLTPKLTCFDSEFDMFFDSTADLFFLIPQLTCFYLKVDFLAEKSLKEKKKRKERGRKEEYIFWCAIPN